MLRSLVLLLALPSLLMPPGMCVCQFAPARPGGDAHRVIAAGNSERGDCCSRCHATHEPKACPAAAGENAAGRGACGDDAPPTERRPDCCAALNTAASAKATPPPVADPPEVAATPDAGFVSKAVPARPERPSLPDLTAASPPVYISFCTLLI